MGSALRSIFEAGQIELFPNMDTIYEAVLDTSNNLYMIQTDMDFLTNTSFQVLSLSDSVTMTSAYAFQRNSEFTKLFDYHLSMLDEAGLLEKIKKKYFYKPFPYDIDSSKAIVLGFDNVILPFIILCIGSVIALR